MAIAFLLRFQEPCLPSEIAPHCGTRTETKTVGENGDADPHANGFFVLRRAAGMGGTATKTAVNGEASDVDREFVEVQYKALPRCC
jgi:hypothetical protein